MPVPDEKTNPQVPGPAPSWPSAPAFGSAECPGDRIGPYKLLEVIGEGGFGTVWLAERREPFTLRVALKIIKAGMDSRAVIARFEQERQALAIMDHPNVARVLDGGVTPAPLGLRPYFVMEYIKGEPITEYCDRHTLTTRERLELFIPVCEAVQHAHTKGIIHRDLKPSNVLVTTVRAGSYSRPTEGTPGRGRPSGSAPDAPIPKVIDFGIAKAVSHSLTDKTIFTEAGQFVGTLEYMSPEQADVGSTDIDTRTDVYSLGVILYELLAGALPFDPVTLRSKAYIEIRRIIREVDPPRPSAKLTSLARGPVAPPGSPIDAEIPTSPDEIARRRRTKLPDLALELKKELEWVPLKAMRKDRNDRYRSPAELADDIRNYLAGHALAAGPESAGYRLRKFVRRNRTAVLVVSTVFLTLLLGVIGTTWGFVAALTAEHEADNKRRLAEAKTIEAETARRETEYGAYIANLVAADASLSADEPSLVRAGLDACPEYLRAWEWRWLNARSDTSVSVIRGHQGWVRSASFNPGGDRIVTASADKTVRIWEAATGRQLTALTGHEDWVATARFSAAGDRIVTASADRTARVWDAASGKELAVFRGHEGLVHTAQFSPTADRVVTSSYDKTARVWDVATGRTLAVLRGHEAEVRSAAFSPSGDLVVTASEDRTARIWDAATGAEVGRLRGHENWVTSALFDPSGDRIVTASGDNTARIWDTAGRKELIVLRGHKDEVWCAEFNPAGDRVVTSSNDETARVWDAASGKELAVLRGHESWVPSASFSPSGDRIVTASADNTARVWDALCDPSAMVLRGHSDWVFWASFSPTADRIVTASHDRTARIWDATTGRTLAVLRGHDKLIHTAVFNPSGDRVATASEDATVRIWDAVTGTQVGALTGHGSAVRSAVYSASGDRIASASSDGTARLWDAATGGELAVLRGHGGVVRFASFSPAGDRLVTASEDRTARVWDIASGRELAVLRGHVKSVFSACFSPSGDRILTASEDNTARLWDPSTGTELSAFRGHESWLNTAVFTPAGDRIVTASGDTTARVWDPVTARQLAVLRGHRNWVFCASFSPAGDRIVTASRDGTARVWDSALYRDRYPTVDRARAAAAKIGPMIRARLEAGKTPGDVARDIDADGTLTAEERTAAHAELFAARGRD